MSSRSDLTSNDARTRVARRPTSNYRVRFRHGVYPKHEGEATRADIKKYDYFFSSEQPWVGSPGDGMFHLHRVSPMRLTHGAVDFIDESAQVAADLDAVEHSRASESIRRAPTRLLRTKTAEKVPQVTSRIIPRATQMRIRPASHVASSISPASEAPSTASNSPMHANFQHRRHNSPATSSMSSPDGSSSIDWQHETCTSSAFEAVNTPRTKWPLSDPIEAHLFRVFVDTHAPRWDTTSSYSVFEKVVPQMALTNSMLLNAVLMTASQIVCRTDASFPIKPFVYHEHVLQDLIPYLADHGRIRDEPTLVAAMLLRGFEESFGASRLVTALHYIWLTVCSWHPWSVASFYI